MYLTYDPTWTRCQQNVSPCEYICVPATNVCLSFFVAITSPLAGGADELLFFFQAEDGIRDLTVTGVQTCALPISTRAGQRRRLCGATHRAGRDPRSQRHPDRDRGGDRRHQPVRRHDSWLREPREIGRASCRERV